jgi:hypothetical protein
VSRSGWESRREPGVFGVHPPSPPKLRRKDRQESRGTVVIVEHATESGTLFDLTRRSRMDWFRYDDPVRQALVIALSVIVGYKVEAAFARTLLQTGSSYALAALRRGIQTPPGGVSIYVVPTAFSPDPRRATSIVSESAALIRLSCRIFALSASRIFGCRPTNPSAGASEWDSCRAGEEKDWRQELRWIDAVY